ncbi:MAG: hypothetical protein M3O15_09090 [Acidobacteriota bacterium]|nr:hypothetical protein [Acidobacteriota bacterium]
MTSASSDEAAAGAYTGQYDYRTGLDGLNGLYFPAWTDRRGGGHEEIWTAAVRDGPTACTPPDVPAGVAAAASGQTRVNLSWHGAPGASLYRLYRSTVEAGSTGPYFPVGLSSSPDFTDAGVECSRSYSYVVAADNGACPSGESSPVEVTTAACSCAAADASILYSKDFESGAGLSDWTVTGSVNGIANWRGIQTCGAKSGSHIFRFGGPSCTSTYQPNDNEVIVPRFESGIAVPAGANSTLSFWHRYDFPTSSDGATLAISLDGGGNYLYAPPLAIVSGVGFNGTLSGPCANFFGLGLPVFTGYQGSFVNTVVSLDAVCRSAGYSSCAGQTIRLAFAGFTGCAGTGTGWFLDDVTVTACPAAAPPLSFYTVTPCRILDTRAGTPLPWHPAFSGGRPVRNPGRHAGGLGESNYRPTAIGGLPERPSGRHPATFDQLTELRRRPGARQFRGPAAGPRWDDRRLRRHRLRSRPAPRRQRVLQVGRRRRSARQRCGARGSSGESSYEPAPERPKNQEAKLLGLMRLAIPPNSHAAETGRGFAEIWW